MCSTNITALQKRNIKKCVHNGIVRFIMCVSFSYPNKSPGYYIIIINDKNMNYNVRKRYIQQG